MVSNQTETKHVRTHLEIRLLLQKTNLPADLVTVVTMGMNSAFTALCAREDRMLDSLDVHFTL